MIGAKAKDFFLAARSTDGQIYKTYGFFICVMFPMNEWTGKMCTWIMLSVSKLWICIHEYSHRKAMLKIFKSCSVRYDRSIIE